MKFLRFTTVFVFLFGLLQLTNLIADDSSNDSLDTNNDFSFKLSEKFNAKQPTVEIIYGMATPVIKSFLSDFERATNMEARFGFTNFDELYNQSSLMEYEFNYFFIGNINSELQENDDNSTEINTDSWRFGFAWSDGQGYKFSDKMNLIFYQTDAWTWTKTRFIDNSNFIKEKNKMDNFGDNFRFGDYFEGGIKFQIYEPITINLGYQRGLVLPRHLFWYWLTSGTIERAGDWVVDWFVDKIGDTSPDFAPIAYFILHNAYSYGFYELRKSKMNWPFNTTEPLMYDGFHLGLTFVF